MVPPALHTSFVQQQQRGIADVSEHAQFLLDKDRSVVSDEKGGEAAGGSGGARGRGKTATRSILPFARQAACSRALLARRLALLCAEGCFPLRAAEAPAMMKLLLGMTQGAIPTPKPPTRHMVEQALRELVQERTAAIKARVGKATACVDQFPRLWPPNRR